VVARHYFGPAPFESVLVAASPSAKSALSHRHGGCVDDQGDHGRIAMSHGWSVTAARSFHPGSSSTCKCLSCWFVELAGRSARRLCIPVFGLVLVPEAPTGRQSLRRDRFNASDTPSEKDSTIVTQFVTQDRHDSIAHSLRPGVLLSGWRDLNPRPLRPESNNNSALTSAFQWV
jgi:hypothetical protein